MANPEHLAILKQGVEAWNAWREQSFNTKPDLREADLSGVNLRSASLRFADLSHARCRYTNFTHADLREANLVAADLGLASLNNADLSAADLSRADCCEAQMGGAFLHNAKLVRTSFGRAQLSSAILSGADLREARFGEDALLWTNLNSAILTGATLERVGIGYTVFANVDLRNVHGLDTVHHVGPSQISIDTLYRSNGDIPEVFLRGCGVPDNMIEYARSLVVRPIDFYSCFISYSSADDALAHRLHADLRAAGVRCWFAPHDLKIGESIIDSIDQSIKLHEKLLLILSESAVTSSWVGLEVKTAIMREQRENRRVLFPIRLDDAVLHSTAGWAGQVNERHIGDFRQWKDHDSYQTEFHRLLRDLKAKRA